MCSIICSHASRCSLLSNIYKSFFFSRRRRHTRLQGDWSSDVCSSDLLYSQLWTTSDRLCNPLHLEHLNDVANLEIGRASCRERVWIWVAVEGIGEDHQSI